MAPTTDTERLLCDIWQGLLKLDKVGITENFFRLGGHSLMAVRLFAEIEKATGAKLPLITLFQAGTIQELARVIAAGEEKSRSLLVPIQPKGQLPPLFLVHGAGGDVLWGYANLAASLGEEQPVYGLKSRGQVGMPEAATLSEMASFYVDQIRAFQPTGPYYLGGYCFGGNVAYEMARQLDARGESVALVALFDSAPSKAGYERVTWWRPSYAPRFVRNIGFWLSDFSRLRISEQWAFVARKTRFLARKLLRRLKPGPQAEVVDLEEVIELSSFPENELKLWQAHLEALVSHADGKFSGPVTLFRTRGQPLLCSLEADFCWGTLAGNLSVKIVPGSHEQIFVEPHVRELARQLRDSLAERRVRNTSLSNAHESLKPQP